MITTKVAYSRLGKPSLIFLYGILLGVLAFYLYPLSFLPVNYSHPAGIIFFILSLILLILSITHIQTTLSEITDYKASVSLMTGGIYKYSRNPVYIAFSLFQIGYACYFNNLWVLIALLVSLTFIIYIVIPGEEKLMEQEYGMAYLKYKRNVRRWI